MRGPEPSLVRARRMAVLACVLAGFAGGAGAAERRLDARFGAEGLSRLDWAGIELLAEGRPAAGKLVFETVTENKDGLNEYAFEKADGSAPRISFDARAKRLSYTYDWGAVDFTYAPEADRLDLTVAISNRSKRTLADFDMKLGALAFPALPMGSDGFSARWSGEVQPRHSEEYTFYTRTDDGVRLWVDGKLIIDKWVNQGATEHAGKIELAAGKRYDIKMEYFENTGDAVARLSWSSPSQEKEVVPTERLFPDAGGTRGTGLEGEYFTDKKLGKLRFTRTEPKVDFDWGTGSPEAPVALGGRGAVLSTLDNVGIVETAFGLREAGGAGGMTERFALACLTMHPPVRMGLAPRPGGADTFDIVLRGGVWADGPGGVEIRPLGLPRVAPGKTLDIELSLRFGVADGDEGGLVADVYERFRTFHGAPLEWPDRRGIAMIMLSSSWSGHKSATNPRGWFNEKKVDVVSEAGRADFRRRAIQYAERSVKILKDMNAQGIIAWDLEGQEHPHPTSFVGDPRLMKLLDPEMEDVADDFFKVFLDADIRTGICIRPTQVYYDRKKKQWRHGTGSHGPERNPLKDDFSDVWPKGTPWWRFFPVVERMCRKIEYAKRRWKCSIFYVDTNGTWRPVGEKGEFK
ncbi:MAG: PA14 domain-containing protein, partial [Planctomycetota bacterium]